jgi:hypothetical protein
VGLVDNDYQSRDDHHVGNDDNEPLLLTVDDHHGA